MTIYLTVSSATVLTHKTLSNVYRDRHFIEGREGSRGRDGCEGGYKNEHAEKE